MGFKVVSDLEADYLRATLTGEVSVLAIPEIIQTVKEKIRQSDRTRVLIDVRALDARMTEVDAFNAGKSIAEQFGVRIKAALLLSEQKLAQMTQLAATNRGARLFVTVSEPEAIDWLTA